MASLACLSTRRTLLALTALAAVACSFPDRTFDDNAFYNTQGGSSGSPQGGKGGASQGGKSGSSQGGAGTSPEGGGTDEVGGDAGSEQGGQGGDEAGGDAGSEQGGDAGDGGDGGDAGTAGTDGGSAGTAGTTAGKGGTAGVSGSSGQGGAGTSGGTAGKGGSAGTTAGTAGKGGAAGMSGSSGQGGSAGTTGGSAGTTGGSAGTGGCGTGSPGANCKSSCDCSSGQICNTPPLSASQKTATCNTGQTGGLDVGQTCAKNADCKSLFCDTYMDTCSLFCASDSDCGGSNRCAQNPYGSDFTLGECLRSCTRNSDCPAPNGGKSAPLCMVLDNADAKTLSTVCNWLGDPGGDNKTFNEVVGTNQGCDSGLTVTSGTTKYCTRMCVNNADCGGILVTCKSLPVPNSGGTTTNISACTP